MKPFLKGFFILNGILSTVTVTAQAQQGPPRAVPGEYLIKFKASSGGSSVARMKLQGKASFKGAFPGLGVMHISMKQDGQEKANYHELKNDPDVEYIEPNYLVDKSQVSSNQPQQFSYDQVVSLGVSTAPNTYAQSNAPTGVANAWPLLTPLRSSTDKVIVAIVDTGLDANHDVFKPYNANGSGGTGAVWVNEVEANGLAGVDDDQNGYVDDINGWNFITNTNDFGDDDSHGTHVAGIIVGAGQNIFARPLQESKVLVMPLKFLDSTGGGTTANAVRAIYYAVNNGARVINNSWGGSGYSSALLDALTYAYDHHVLVVTAAGNYSSDNDASPMYPASYNVPSNLAVASTSSYDSLSSFSNYGATSVQVGSPGEYINSTIPRNLMMKMSGTSMATPFVSGLAALAFREAPALSGYQIKQVITDTVLQNNYLTGKVSSTGRIDPVALIQIAQTMVSATANQPSYKPQYLVDSRAPASSGGAAGCGLVRSVIKNGPGSGDGSSNPTAGIVLGLMLAPLALWQVLRARAPQNKRRYERFKMNSEVRVSVGDRELVGSVNTISEGGLSFDTDAALEKGGIVRMRIQSPDGREVIEVQGQVVWSEKSQSYGVQFSNAKQGTLAMIRDWTAGLIKT
ncbi:MAG: S8 family serine peptidase [Bdellovibrio sp.]